MKNLLVSFLLLFIVNNSFSQVSDATVIAKIKASNKGIVSLKLTGKGWTERVLEEGVWVKYYRRSYELTQKSPEKPNLKLLTVNHLTYRNAGGGYKFNGFGVPNYRLLGIPDPDKEEVIAYLKADYINFLQSHHYNNIVGEVSEITFPDEVDFWWKDIDRVHFNVQVTYSEKVSYTELEKASHIYEVVLYYNGDYKGGMKSFLSVEENTKRVVISKTSYPADELEAMKTLQMVDEENKAKAEQSALPTVNVPEFQSDRQAIYFLHEKLMTSDVPTAKAYLYKMISSSRKEGEYILKGYAQEWVDKVVNNLSTYQKTFCNYPMIKEEQSGQIAFYDKERYKNVKFVVAEEDGTWKVNNIYYYPSAKEDADRMATINGTCSEKPDLTVKEVIRYEIGDAVNARFSNGTYPAIINKKDSNFPNRYYVKLEDDGSGYWMTDEFLTPRTASSTSTTEEPQQMGSVSYEEEEVKGEAFKVNDKVGVKTRSGVMKGKIIKVSNNKYLVKFRDPRYQDLWVSENNLERL